MQSEDKISGKNSHSSYRNNKYCLYNKEKIILISNDYFLPDLQNEISEILLDIEEGGC